MRGSTDVQNDTEAVTAMRTLETFGRLTVVAQRQLLEERGDVGEVIRIGHRAFDVIDVLADEMD